MVTVIVACTLMIFFFGPEDGDSIFVRNIAVSRLVYTLPRLKRAGTLTVTTVKTSNLTYKFTNIVLQGPKSLLTANDQQPTFDYYINTS
jgi:hypothetical protein